MNRLNRLKHLIQLTLLGITLNLIGCQSFNTPTPEEIRVAKESQVIRHYADLAHAIYQDAAGMAEKLRHANHLLVLSPSPEKLNDAKEAWLNARIPYMQSEVFRFGHAIVDDWEGGLNAWPLDEGLIDYVDTDSYESALGNVGAKANIVANKILRMGTSALNASQITPELLKSLNEFGGSEANVATGYHAIEFLLWGQDLYGSQFGSGERPYSDYLTKTDSAGNICTNGHCDRRGAYLIAVSQLLVDDLHYMAKLWSEQGAYRKEFLSEAHSAALNKIIFGMGSLSMGELAGERMKVALEANSVEDEHDCFSDNTHYSHYYNALGIQNIFLGQYKPTNAPLMTGPSLNQLIAFSSPALANQTEQALAATMESIQNMVSKAEDPIEPMHFDMMIAEGNEEGALIIQDSMNKLRVQTELFDQIKPMLVNPPPVL